jgi:two-component system sensor histidine kinase HydH
VNVKEVLINNINHIIRAILFLLLAFFSFAMIYSTHQNTRTARSLARTSLESTALALSTAAENVLRKSRTDKETEIRDILSDRVIAYALIARRDGTILFHTNPRLAGQILPQNEVDRQLAEGSVSNREITLGTGTPAYEFNFTLHRPDGSDELLRLILHTAEADLIVARAERMWWLVGVSLLLIWTAGLVLERVATRYISLQALLEEQKRLTLIGQMAAVLAHEIRNALVSVKGYAQWINERTPESKSFKTAVEAILQGTGRIESLVNELLIFSRQEHYKTEPVELKELIDEAAGSGLSGWQGKTEMEIEPGKFVKADREKLYRTLVNGMRNAVEAMEGEGTLRIALSSEGSWVTLRIEDTGPGIPEEEVRRLFTPFYTTKTEGTGLGLAYSKKVVEGMRGKIELENRKDKRGAVLSIRLPAS